MFNIQDIIALAIRIEQNGRDFFLDAIENGVETELADIFRWMAEEENRHIEWFEKLKQDALALPAGSLLEQNQSAALGSILGKQKFSLDAMDVGRIENTDELIAKLIEFEYDTVLFYEMIKTAVSSADAANLLDEIIAEERQHIRKLKEYRDEKRVSC